MGIVFQASASATGAGGVQYHREMCGAHTHGTECTSYNQSHVTNS